MKEDWSKEDGAKKTFFTRPQPWTLKVGDTCSKILLLGAGLGEHSLEIKVCNIYSCSMGVSFPKLNHCGGFEMLRCLSNSKDLVLVEGTCGR